MLTMGEFPLEVYLWFTALCDPVAVGNTAIGTHSTVKEEQLTHCKLILLSVLFLKKKKSHPNTVSMEKKASLDFNVLPIKTQSDKKKSSTNITFTLDG